jgi:hypothetical protein
MKDFAIAVESEIGALLRPFSPLSRPQRPGAASPEPQGLRGPLLGKHRYLRGAFVP